MRIDINQGSLNTFFIGVSSFGNDTSSVSQLDSILSRTDSLQGGLGQLGSAYSSLQSVRTVENNRRAATRAVRARTNSVISEAVNSDNDVANMLDREHESFYAVNEWARPVVEESQGFWSSVWGGISDFGSWAWGGISGFGSWAWGGISGFGSWAWGGISGFGNWVWGGIGTAWGWITGDSTGAQVTRRIGQLFIEIAILLIGFLTGGTTIPDLYINPFNRPVGEPA